MLQREEETALNTEGLEGTASRCEDDKYVAG